MFPQTREQRCWFHKIANVLAALPKSAHPGAKKALAEIWNAEDKHHARHAVKAFAGLYGAKFPKAVAKITDDLEELLAFYDYPAEHWIHLRTTNPIESTFATVRHRTKVTKGPGSKAAGIAMAFKLIEAAQDRWRAVNAPHLVALVRAGARFERGKLVERDPALEATQQAPWPRRQPRRPPPRISPSTPPHNDLHPQVLTIPPNYSRHDEHAVTRTVSSQNSTAQRDALTRSRPMASATTTRPALLAWCVGQPGRRGH